MNFALISWSLKESYGGVGIMPWKRVDTTSGQAIYFLGLIAYS